MTQPNETQELKPCPFCNLAPETGITGAPECDNWRYVKCSNDCCPVRFCLFSVKGWNSRASVAAPPPDVDKELIEAIAQPWICVEERPCEEAVAVHWNEMIEALSAGIGRPSPVAATVDAETQVNAMWEALKAECCKNPAEAKLAVFVSERKFKKALEPFAAILSKRLGSAAVPEQPEGEQEPSAIAIRAALAHAKKLNAETETVFTDNQGTWFGARLDNHPTTAAFEMCDTCLQLEGHEDECPEGYHPMSAESYCAHGGVAGSNECLLCGPVAAATPTSTEDAAGWW